MAAMLAGCVSQPAETDGETTRREAQRAVVAEPPERFTIAPDDYHVPYAGTAEDGRKFLLSEELFSFESGDADGTAYVGLFLWAADGTYYINIQPGDFIAYYEPWDGLGYDT